MNPNPMEEKSKTFVRGFVPKFIRQKKGKGKGKVEILPENGVGGDASKEKMEILTHGAPPEGINVHGPPHTTQAGEEFDGIEYDDDAPVETPDGGLLHHHHYGTKRPHWKLTTWEDLKVGDFVKIMDNESIPADVLICATSEEENVAFVETKNLDGETNLKSRVACPVLTHLRTAGDIANPVNSFNIDCDKPDTHLYRLNAAIVGQDGEKAPVDTQMVLLRGTILRNTRWAIGVVLYTGQDTKIVMNSGDTPSKRSRVERQMNPQVYVILILVRLRVLIFLDVLALSI